MLWNTDIQLTYHQFLFFGSHKAGCGNYKTLQHSCGFRCCALALWILEENVIVDKKQLLCQAKIQLVSTSHGFSGPANHFLEIMWWRLVSFPPFNTSLIMWWLYSGCSFSSVCIDFEKNSSISSWSQWDLFLTSLPKPVSSFVNCR